VEKEVAEAMEVEGTKPQDSSDVGMLAPCTPLSGTSKLNMDGTPQQRAGVHVARRCQKCVKDKHDGQSVLEQLFFTN